GGKLEATEETARQRGTTVTVRGLFYNTPARRKFLRASTTETRAAVEAVTVLALTRPDVAFSVTNDGRVLLDCQPANRLIDRVRALWGAELAETLLEVSHRAGPLEVSGLVQRPAQARPAGRKGYVFVRGRPIRDPFSAPGQGSGVWFQGQSDSGSAHPGMPLELFRSDALTADPKHLAPPLLQVFQTFILFQTDQGIAIVDQHSAHERVLYEDVMRQLGGDGATAQRLLLPLTLDFEPAELDAI